MTLQAWLDSPIVVRLGWTIIHSLWQITLIALLLAITLPVLRRRSSHWASSAACFAMLSCLVVPVLTFSLLNIPSEPLITSSDLKPQSARALSDQHVQSVTRITANDPSSANDTINNPGTNVASTSIRQSTTDHQVVSEARRTEVATETIESRIRNWLPAVVGCWLIGVLLLSVFNCSTWLFVQRLKSQATTAVTASLEQTFVRLSHQMGLSTPVRLLQSVLVDSPVVIGALRPVILLPASLVLQLPPDQLESLLVHELAHVLRHDYLINLIQTAIETLLFYHPCVWWIARQVRQEREHCCDDIALRQTRDRTIYVRALAAVAGVRVPATSPAASGGQLSQRLRRILGIRPADAAQPARWIAGVSLLVFIGLFSAVCVLPKQAAVAKQSTELTDDDDGTKPRSNADMPRTTTPGMMTVTVVDVSGNPLKDAEILAAVWTDDETFNHNQRSTTDADGVAQITLPKSLYILRVWAFKKSHCSLFANWEGETLLDKDPIPREFTFRLQPGTVIGGIVKDEQGQPIPNVNVQVMRTGESKSVAVRTVYDTWLAAGDSDSVNGSRTTDRNGRWTLDTVPAGDEIDIEVLLNHPDYISDQDWGQTQHEQKVAMSAFRDQSATIFMSRGFSIEGQVTDPDGNPIEQAVVVWGDNPYFQTGSQEVLTDAAGRYRIPPLPKSRMRVTIVAKGWAPESRRVDVGPDLNQVNFSLKSGKKFQIQFVDIRGTPVKNVDVQVESWRGSKALYNDEHPNVIDTQIPRQSDEQGRYEWDWAPEDAVTFSFGNLEFTSLTKTMVPSESVQRVVLQKILTISGRVRDARTGEPIERFHVIPIDHFRDDFSSLDRTNAQPHSDGEFTFQMERSDVKQGIQIEAAGYRPFRTTKRYQPGDDDDDLDIRLEHAESPKEKVLSPDGTVATSAIICVGTQSDQLTIRDLNIRQEWREGELHFETNDAGEFEIPAQIDPYVLVVFSPDGFAQISREADQQPGTIHLQQWASIKGRLTQSGKPVPSCEIQMSTIRSPSGGRPQFDCALQATTEEDGTFVFSRVPPIPVHVKPSLHFSRDSVLTSAHSIPVQPKPGQILEVAHEQPGATLTGKLIGPSQPADFDYHFALAYLIAKSPAIDMPGTTLAQDLAESVNVCTEVNCSPEVQAYLDKRHHWFVKPSPDGTIQITGVAPGEYNLVVNLYSATEGCLDKSVAKSVIPVTVKSGVGAVDLGKLKIASVDSQETDPSLPSTETKTTNVVERPDSNDGEIDDNDIISMITASRAEFPAETEPEFIASRSSAICFVVASPAVQKELALDEAAILKVRRVVMSYRRTLIQPRETLVRDKRQIKQAEVPNYEWKEKVKALLDTYRTETRKANEEIREKIVPQLKEALTEQQMTRLQQIAWQTYGSLDLATDTVLIKELDLRPDQLGKIASINQAYQQTVVKLSRIGILVTEHLHAAHARDANAIQILSNVQREKFKSLQGRQFNPALLWLSPAWLSDANQPSNRDSKDRSIQRQLDSLCNVDFDGVPMNQALKTLSKQQNVEIWFDEKAISDAGLKMDEKVNLKLTGVSMRSIFKLCLEPLALGEVVEDGVVKVTTRTKIDEQQKGRKPIANELAQAAPGAAGPAAPAVPVRGNLAQNRSNDVIFLLAELPLIQKELDINTEAAKNLTSIKEQFTREWQEAGGGTRNSVRRLSDGTFQNGLDPVMPPLGLRQRINLTEAERDEFTAKFTKLWYELNSKYQDQLKQALTEDQFRRLQQIHWQNLGPAACLEPPVIAALMISNEQQQKVAEVIKIYRQQIMIARMPRPDGPNQTDKLDELTKEQDAKVNDVLTAQQRGQLVALKGTLFKLPTPLSTPQPPRQMYDSGLRGGIYSVFGNEAIEKELQLSAEALVALTEIKHKFSLAWQKQGGGFRTRTVRRSVGGMTTFQEAATPPFGMQVPPNPTPEQYTQILSQRLDVWYATVAQFEPDLKQNLTAEQYKRLKQIYWQAMGTAAYDDPEVIQTLGVTKDQQDKIRAIKMDYQDRRTVVFRANDPPDPKELAAKQKQLVSEQDKKVNETLTKEQLDQFATLKGKPFDVTPLLDADQVPSPNP